MTTVTEKKYKATIEILSDTEILITRGFNAPRDLVFEVMTKPEHVREWYGCATMTVVSCEIDLRVGGKWRYVVRMDDGREMAFSGAYIEIVAPSKIVSTENFEPIGPGHEMVATVTLEDTNGRTVLRNRLKYQSKADRDGHLQSGMERGMNETFDHLEVLAQSLAIKNN